MISTCIYFCIISFAAVAAVGSVAACGDERAAADEVERVALRQFNARTRAGGGGGIGSRAGKRCARGDVEVHRALNLQAAAARGRVGETEVARDVVVRRVTCAAERLPRRGASIQRRPVGRGGLRLLIDRSPFVLCPRARDCRQQHGEHH